MLALQLFAVIALPCLAYRRQSAAQRRTLTGGGAYYGQYGSSLAGQSPAYSASLQPDSEPYRDGSLTRVGMPNPFGANPYGINAGSEGPRLADLSASEGTVYTDDSENGFRIRKGLLDMHNYVRKVEAPAATWMTKLVWDFHLEAYSRQWAMALCTNPTTKYFEHSPDSSTGLPTWPFRIGTGENLYTSSAVRQPDDDFSDVVSKWYAEREDYDWATGNAKPGATQPIGHYKQLVRPQVTMVGCTVVSGCKQQGDWRTFVVCHYDYGNIGKDPYEPQYDAEATCPSCPTGYTCCEQGLCSGRISQGATGFSPFTPAVEASEAWYGCQTHRRSDCAGTGASSFTERLPGDAYDLEFNQCHCGAGPSSANFADTVAHGYFYFRNKCYQAVNGAGDDLTYDTSLYAMLEQEYSKQELDRLRNSPPESPYVDGPRKAKPLTKSITRFFSKGRGSNKRLFGGSNLSNNTMVAAPRHLKQTSEKHMKHLTTPATPPPKHVVSNNSDSEKLGSGSRLESDAYEVEGEHGVEAVL